MHEDEDSLLRSVTQRNAHSIERARQRVERELVVANEALELRTQELELLNRTGAAIALTHDLRELVQAVTDAATQLTGAEFGAFFHSNADEKSVEYLPHTLASSSRAVCDGFSDVQATSLFEATFRGEGTVRCDDVQKHPRYGKGELKELSPNGQLPIRSYLAVPVVSRNDDIVGGLFFGHSDTGVFTDRIERVVVSLAAQAAVAIDNARLYENLKTAAAERERLFDAERAARAEAERASRMKDEFLATLSHELRTPLNAILGWSQVLLARKGADDDLKRGLETIARNARAQTQLIDDLLDMSRIVSGKVRLDVQPLDLSSVVDAAVDSVRPSAEAKGIRLQKILDPLAGPVSGDPNRLQQVVWNLLSNAIKFTPKGGKVEVLLARVNSHLEVTVTDSGQGISAAFLPYVFDRFRQADASSTRIYSGLGLGLSIVKQLVELHGGSVQAKSDGDNCGATFIVRLPLAPVRSGESRENPTAMRSSGIEWEQIPLDGIKVLVVDDEADARELIKQVLVQCGAAVTTASSSDEGLQVLQALRPHVLVSDIGMPDKDGYQFMRDLRSISAAKGGNTPAIALTAFARSEDRTRAMVAGYQIHISKPIEPQELIATVASLAGRTGTPRVD